MTSIARREEQDETGDYSESSQEVDHNNSGNDVPQNESDYDSQGSDSEHSEGDPENQETEKKVDDDEDRSNPQYIPKRGTFYEHDDRTAASGEESSNTISEASEKKEGSESGAVERKRPPRKSEVVNKWSHDKYNENEQLPKSRDELVAIYGYDIRNEDAPPHARRNRRYGRGPNKYTRTWEDEEAYRRQAAAAQPAPRRPLRAEDFPALDGRPKRRSQRPRSKSQPNSIESVENGTNLRRNASVKAKGKVTPRAPNTRTVANKNNLNKSRDSKEILPGIENLTITTTVGNNNQNSQPQRKVNAAVAQQKPVPTELAKKKPVQQSQPQQQNNVSSNKSPPQQQNQQKPQSAQPPQQAQNQQNNAVSGLENRAGSKRYSSLRQRPITETFTPQPNPSPGQQPQAQPQGQPPQGQQPQGQGQQLTQVQGQAQQQHRYHNEYNSGGQPSPHQGSPAAQPHPQQMMHQVNQQVHRTAAVKQQPHGPSPPHQQMPQQTQQQVRLNMLEQQQIVQHQHHTMHNLQQPHAMGQMPQAQGYAPPAIMPAQYMQQGPQFGGAPMFAQPPGPYPQHLYQHHNYATQAGGVTYYSCPEPESNPRPPRRPTAAIPIVRPTPQRQANSSEKDNIDRIVENMFVRKPWPATCDAKDKEKDKQQPENRNSQEPAKEAPSIPAEAKPVEVKEEPAPVEQETNTETQKSNENVETVENQPEIVDSTQNA